MTHKEWIQDKIDTLKEKLAAFEGGPTLAVFLEFPDLADVRIIDDELALEREDLVYSWGCIEGAMSATDQTVGELLEALEIEL